MLLSLCMVVSLLPAISIPASAANITVMNETDLRAAVEGDSDFNVTLGSNITLTSALNIYTSGTIDGGGYTLSASVTGTDAQGITNSNASDYNILWLRSGNLTVDISDMTIKGGAKSAVSSTGSMVNLIMSNVIITQSGSDSCAGGGLNFDNGTAVLKNCALTRNVANYGGGFCNEGTLVMDGCSVTENRNIGGAMRGGGGGENKGTLYLNNSTIANNESTEIGGAINNCAGTLYVMNSDIVGNVSTNGSSANYGGGIGQNGNAIYIINSVLANNYATTIGGTYIASDFGAFSGGTVSVINSICGAYVTDAVGTMGTPDTNVYNIINAPGNSQTGIFTQYVSSPLLNADGTEVTGTSFSRPVLIKQPNRTYTAPLVSGSTASSGGTNTYFDYSDLTNIIVAYGSTPTYLKGTSSAVSGNAVTTYQGGTSRADGVIGAMGSSSTTYRTVSVQPNANGTVTGGTVFGDVYADGTSVTLKAVPDSDYAFSKWQKLNGSKWEDISGATASTYTFNVTADVSIQAVFQKANAKVTLQKDGAVWTDSGYTLKLCKNGNTGNEPYIDLTDTGTGIYTAAVEPSAYHIYDGSTIQHFIALDLGLVEVEVGTTGTATLNYYSVSYTGNHVSFSPKPTVILGNKDLYPNLSPDSGYKRPASISVTMVGQSSMTLVASAADADEAGEYYYDPTTGEIIIANVTGAVSISAAGLSSNANLATILTKTVSASLDLGTTLAPKTASVSVSNAVASVTKNDIVPTDIGAAVTFYGTDSTFGTPVTGSISLTAGSGTVVYVKATAADSTVLYYAVTINRAPASSGGSGGSSTGTAATGGAPVIVNKETYTAGTSKDTTEGGKTVTQVTVDTGKLQSILAAKGQNASVVIPVTTGSEVVSGVLTGQMVRNMETQNATLEIQTNSATYTLPTSEINIDAISKQLGESVALSDIQVNVQIAEPSDTTVKVVNNAATSNSFSLMVPAVDFSISCTNSGKTVAVSSFNSYVERTIAIPDGVDPTKITTGVVVEADGTTRHVPTQVTRINGKYYAKINSLTNSTYAVIWHPIEFADVTDHWAKDAINDMGSRMVINGVGDNKYEPDRDITRAEFAAIVVRALGLEPGTQKSSFGDVAASDWYCGYIETASSYGIVNGYNATTFGPNDKITREQAMTMIARAMKITGLDATLTDSEMVTLLASYTDSANASDYAKTSIAACLKTGVVTGRSNSTVAPKENITRAEVAVIVQRLLKDSKLI